MRVLFVAAEVAPLAKVGGLADVAGALPPALARLGLEVAVVMPRYASVEPGRHGLERLALDYEVPGEDGEPLRCGLWRGSIGRPAVPVYLVEEPRYLTRPEIYGAPDDLDRFTVFCRAALGAATALGWRPDLVHANDWHTALLPAWLARGWDAAAAFPGVAGVLTLHNLAFQGWFDEGFVRRWSIAPTAVWAERRAGVPLSSTLALGIAEADLVITVSPTYAREILGPEQGFGLEALLAARTERLFGILNGLDTELFDPATDPAIEPRFDLQQLDRRDAAKRALQRELGLPEAADRPLIGVVGRLTEQKGFDLALPALEELLAERPAQLALLGNGETRYEDGFRDLHRRHPDAVAVRIGFDLALAQRIYAGSDIFLMPSRFEPCGLGQLIALRYGAVPLVHATGGLRDTVHDRDGDHGEPNGFAFERYSVGALLLALGRALEAYRQPEVWRGLQRAGMRPDRSWAASAARYAELYAEVALPAARRRAAAD